MFSKISISVLHITDLSYAKPVGTQSSRAEHRISNKLFINKCNIFKNNKTITQTPIAESCR